MGRKMKIVESNKKHLTKEEKIARKTIQEKASDGLDALQLTPPKHFDPIAKAEYKRVIEDLRKLPLRNLDRAVLESYCTWYAVYKEISRGLQKEGYVYETDNGKVLPNKMLYSLERATTNLMKAASQLGMTVDSRMKLFVPQVEEKKESIFDKFGS
ncbi:phage terminase small subunit P27 family [Streptococcus infantis]|uniref:phage terminase small subunit P27 family n=1 Tax=Streptococcus infantis TaxID=68892 RepID=UPI0039C4B05B